MTAAMLDIEPDHADSWQLVARAQAGDTEAFGALYDRYYDTVYRFLRFRTDPHVAEELAAEVWLRALRRIGTISYIGRDFGAWVVTIAKNLLTDHFKSAHTRLSVPSDDPAAELQVEDNASTVALRRAEHHELHAAMGQLTDEQRAVLWLRYFADFDVDQTAERLGIETGAVTSRSMRAIRSLRRLLQPAVAA